MGRAYGKRKCTVLNLKAIQEMRIEAIRSHISSIKTTIIWMGTSQTNETLSPPLSP